MVQMGALAPAVLLLRRVRSRTRLVQVAAGAGLACVLMTVGDGHARRTDAEVHRGRRRPALSLVRARRASSCAAACRSSSGRSASSPTSAWSSSPNSAHPLLQELIRRAPGTYTHSMTVATLAESAAEAIGANVLLVRVGSYFHDVGKMLKPHYFIENQTGAERPRRPGTGPEHAGHHRPRQGRHGPGRAVPPARADRRPDPAAPRHDAGRVLLPRSRCGSYDGGTARRGWRRRSAIPARSRRSREAGILMLADAVESSSRALSTPTPGEPDEAGPRPADEAAARRPIRGERPDADRVAADRRKPGQEPDRPVPRTDQVPRRRRRGEPPPLPMAS